MVLKVEWVDSRRAGGCGHQELHQPSEFVCILFCAFGFFDLFLWFWEGVHRFLSDSKRRKCLKKVNQYLREAWRFYFCSFSHPLRLSYSHNVYFMGNVAWYLWRPRRIVLSDNISKFRNTRSCHEFEWEFSLNLLPWVLCVFCFPLKSRDLATSRWGLNCRERMMGTDLLLRFSGPVGIHDCWKLMQNDRWMLRVDFFFLSNKTLIKAFYVYIVVTSNNLKLP